jgi:hypothetical protein
VIWLTWRQFRVPAVVSAAALAAVLTLLAVTGPRMVDRFDAGGLAVCAAGHEPTTGTLTCGDLERLYLDDYPVVQVVGALLLLLPALVGAFWGAPLVAREIETGTHRLAWVQSVTRSRWLGTKLAVLGGSSVALSAALSLALTWWNEPRDRLGSRFTPAIFAQRGVVPIAYAAFAFALGVAAGAVIRRTIPAMAAALLGFLALREYVASAIRPHLVDRVVASFPTFTFVADEPAGRVASESGWVLSAQTVDGAGHVVSRGGTISDEAVFRLCHLNGTQVSKIDLDACGQRLGLRDVVSYIPADRFWAVQVREAALYLVLALALGAVTFWWVRRRLT